MWAGWGVRGGFDGGWIPHHPVQYVKLKPRDCSRMMLGVSVNGQLCEELLQHGCGRLPGFNDGALLYGEQWSKVGDMSARCCGLREGAKCYGGFVLCMVVSSMVGGRGGCLCKLL